MARSEVVGGPHDGRETASTRHAWAFIGPDGRKHRKAARGRALYVNRGVMWEFANLASFVCDGCGALNRPAAPTSVCAACGARHA